MRIEYNSRKTRREESWSGRESADGMRLTQGGSTMVDVTLWSATLWCEDGAEVTGSWEASRAEALQALRGAHPSRGADIEAALAEWARAEEAEAERRARMDSFRQFERVAEARILRINATLPSGVPRTQGFSDGERVLRSVPKRGTCRALYAELFGAEEAVEVRGAWWLRVSPEVLDQIAQLDGLNTFGAEAGPSHLAHLYGVEEVLSRGYPALRRGHPSRSFEPIA